VDPPPLIGEDPCDVVVRQWVAESKKLDHAEARLSQIILAFVIIDTLAWSGLPAHRRRVNKTDFIEWVARYLRQDLRPGELLEYNYDPEQIYRYRCGILHTLSGQDLLIAFHDGPEHRFRPDIHTEFVAISIPRLYDDLWLGIAQFLADSLAGGSYRIVQARFGEMFRLMPPRIKENDSALNQNT